jgi:hypothetical protein
MRITRRLVQLFAGLVLYGVSMGLLVESRLGLDPWDVFHQGLSKVTGLSFGLVVILTGIPVLVLWIPLRQRPGFGTLANLVLVGLVADRALALLPPGTNWPARIGYLAGGDGPLHRQPVRPRPARRPHDRHRRPVPPAVDPAGAHLHRAHRAQRRLPARRHGRRRYGGLRTGYRTAGPALSETLRPAVTGQ